jgi:hypothetical protein
MANQIKRSEIAEEDLYKDIRVSAEKTIEFVEYLNSTLKETAIVIQKDLKKPLDNTIESIDNLNKSSKLMNETMEQQQKLDKAKADAIKTQLKAEAKLKAIEKEKQKQKKETVKLTEEELRAKLKDQKASAEQKRILQDEIILNDKNAGTLEKVAAQSRVLRREREKLNLETQEGKKRLKEINDQLDENNEIIRENSDALKQQKLNVGNYTDSIKEATGELGGLIGGIKDSIDGIKEQAKSFLVMAKTADTAGAKTRVLGKALKATIIGVVIAGLGAVVSSIADTREGMLKLQGTIQKVMGGISIIGNFLSDKFKQLTLNIQLAKIQMQQLFSVGKEAQDLRNQITDINKELDDLSKKSYEFGEMATNIDESIKATFKYEDALAKTGEEIERLLGLEEILGDRAGDMTISFDKQRRAQEQYNETVTKRIGLEKGLAQQNVDLQALKIKQKLIEAGLNYSDVQIKNLEFLNDENARMKINSDQLAELSEAKKELVGKETELNSALAKMAMERRNTEKDDFEKQLDYAIDAFDVQKTVNERIINMERTTLAQREVLTEETRRLADKAFKNQIGLVQDYTKQRIDFDALVKMSDEEEIRRTLAKNDLNETTLTRILEIIKERKLVLQDLSDLEIETANKRLEKNREILSSEQNINQDAYDLKAEIMEREFELQKYLNDREVILNRAVNYEAIEDFKKRVDAIRSLKVQQLKEQADYDREQINSEVFEEDVKAQKIEEINRKLVNDIIRLQNEALDKKIEIDRDLLEKERDLAQARTEFQIQAVQSLTDLSNELTDRRIAKIDEEIEASQRRFDTLSGLAESGNILAKESMAEEAKLMAEQNRKREQLERRKQRIQLASTVLETYLTNSANPNVKNPLQKTITDTVLLTEFIKSLPAFFEGTEDTGKDGKGLDNKGGFLSVLHPNERVITAKQNDLIGGMSNEDLSKLAYNYQNGMIRNINDTQIGSSFMGVDILAKKLDSLERTIANKPEHTLQVEQIIGGVMAISRSTKQGNTKIYNRYRV